MNHTSLPFVILLAEDELADAHLVKTALAEKCIPADLRHVLDGREVLDYLRRQGSRFAAAPRPHLILLDLNMPRMDGRECLAALKQDPTLSDIPVVILTTSGAEFDIVTSYRLGAAGYITKPVDVVQFIHALGDLCTYWMSVVRLPGQMAQARI
jgi:CheY-like chemotaxis protein